jgi:predicted XRE-type DNA-binding protein
LKGKVEMNPIEIRIWLLRESITVKDIAGSLKISVSAVNYFINGKMKSKKVLNWFLAKGCPKEFLSPDKKALSTF